MSKTIFILLTVRKLEGVLRQRNSKRNKDRIIP